jgi:cellulose synthase operon protein C
MRLRAVTLLIVALLVSACATNPDKRTLAQLSHVRPDLSDVHVADSLERAMESYRRFLEETPENVLTPEAMRRLADLQIEREYGIIGDGGVIELEASDPEDASRDARVALESRLRVAEHPELHGIADVSESESDFEERASGPQAIASVDESSGFESSGIRLPEGADAMAPSGPLEAIAIYQRILEEYPNYERNDQVLYQMARAYDEIGAPDEALVVMERLVAEYPLSRRIDEVHFRRGEYYFVRRKFREAEAAYSSIIGMSMESSFRELGLYKLGWSLYKQDFYEEAMHRFVGLLDLKHADGYDFNQMRPEDDDEERRVSDTFRVISLSLSNLGGPEVIDEYFSTYGNRSYEDRIYSNLGEFYLSKLRFQDAAAVYDSFVELNPFHRASPHFSMRVVEIYTEGDFPRLVVESKKGFAQRYGLKAAYWQHFDVFDAPDVLSFLKSNLQDLAQHYHALYQEPELEDDQLENYAEARLWYREFLDSFPQDPESPPINYQFADLLLEHEDYAAAAIEYERTAYDYPAHEQDSAAGYAAIYAHREHLKVAAEGQSMAVKQATVSSSLRFADAFPHHEHAPVVLGAAADDLYDMKAYADAIAAASKLIDRYPDAEVGLRRAAWAVVAHSSFELAAYEQAEHAYARVLGLTPADDDTRPALIENLAASIYKQGELANEQLDHQTAAAHFLRIKEVTPTSEIRAAAEYDAAAALMRLEDWDRAAGVLEDFRSAHPSHGLQEDATKQLAFVYREAGELAKSALEYERVADDSDDPELRSEALLLAGELYEEAGEAGSALSVYERYVDEFPRPLELALETRYKIAGMYQARGDRARYHQELSRIVDIDRGAGPDRSDRSRYLGARSSLVLTEKLYGHFAEVRLTQPFDRSLAEKQKRMDEALQGFEALVEYEVAEVTAAATFYIAEIYAEFSRSLLASERPAGLSASELLDYDEVIEEEAFPFEERAISVHEANRELMLAGVFNGWVEQSMGRLAEMVPGRYAKAEISSGFMGSIDSYAYRQPNAPDPDDADPGSEPVPPADEPAVTMDGGGAGAPGAWSRDHEPVMAGVGDAIRP